MEQQTRSAFRKEILLVLLVKFVLLLILWWLFFAPDHRPGISPAAVGDALLSAPASGNTTSSSPSSGKGAVRP